MWPWVVGKVVRSLHWGHIPGHVCDILKGNKVSMPHLQGKPTRGIRITFQGSCLVLIALFSSHNLMTSLMLAARFLLPDLGPRQVMLRRAETLIIINWTVIKKKVLVVKTSKDNVRNQMIQSLVHIFLFLSLGHGAVLLLLLLLLPMMTNGATWPEAL